MRTPKILIECSLDLEGISQEVDKFLKEKEKHIRETIIAPEQLKSWTILHLTLESKKHIYAQKIVKNHIQYLPK